MPYPISLDLHAKQTSSLKQTQRLIMSPQMQQAIHLLQMPLPELSTVLETELNQNPVIEFIENEEDENSSLKKLEEDNAEEPEEQEQPPEKELTFTENDFEILKRLDEDFRDPFGDSHYSSCRTQDEDKLKSFQESSLCAETSLFEHLMQQAREVFSQPKDRAIAEAIIGNLDENGFLQTPLEEISILNSFPMNELKPILKQIQTFEPHGIAASDVQESLLIQLRCQHKQKTLAYKIIEKYYDDLIHNHIPMIKKGLECSAEEISKSLKMDISRLDLHPGLGHFKHFVQYITPDATVQLENETLKVKINDDFLPPIRINRKYLRMLTDESVTAESKEFIRQKLSAAKWLLQNVHQRNETLLKIVELLTTLQKDFFLDPKGKLQPLTMKIVAGELNLHESTIARAVANKYVETPRGLLPLRSFFTQGLNTQKGDDISASAVKTLLREFIENENKSHPLSDAELSKLLMIKGIACARRTIAKYRTELNLGNAHQRRKYH